MMTNTKKFIVLFLEDMPTVVLEEGGKAKVSGKKKRVRFHAQPWLPYYYPNSYHATLSAAELDENLKIIRAWLPQDKAARLLIVEEMLYIRADKDAKF
jgi:hypothetical protein